MNALTNAQKVAILDQFETYAETLATAEPTTTARTWGFEIETPDADNVYARTTYDQREGTLDFKGDGSVERAYGGDCECECSDCVHSCDCDNCDLTNGYTSLDHCGNGDCSGTGDYQEITSVGGISTTHPTALAILDQAGITDCETNDTTGLHIHLGSADLTPEQVARVISTYRQALHILDPLAGRSGVYYAQAPRLEHSEDARQGYASEKYRAVNTATHFHGGSFRPKTIEFRQHAGETNVDKIRAWAMLLIEIVEFAKGNASVFWIGGARDLNHLRQLLRDR
jgi:hypothetical protein